MSDYEEALLELDRLSKSRNKKVSKFFLDNRERLLSTLQKIRSWTDGDCIEGVDYGRIEIATSILNKATKVLCITNSLLLSAVLNVILANALNEPSRSTDNTIKQAREYLRAHQRALVSEKKTPFCYYLRLVAGALILLEKIISIKDECSDKKGPQVSPARAIDDPLIQFLNSYEKWLVILVEQPPLVRRKLNVFNELMYQLFAELGQFIDLPEILEAEHHFEQLRRSVAEKIFKPNEKIAIDTFQDFKRAMFDLQKAIGKYSLELGLHRVTVNLSTDTLRTVHRIEAQTKSRADSVQKMQKRRETENQCFVFWTEYSKGPIENAVTEGKRAHEDLLEIPRYANYLKSNGLNTAAKITKAIRNARNRFKSSTQE